MAELINLNRVRKARARADKEAQAAENRIKFGRTKAEREKAEAERSLATRQLDSHKRTDET